MNRNLISGGKIQAISRIDEDRQHDIHRPRDQVLADPADAAAMRHRRRQRLLRRTLHERDVGGAARFKGFEIGHGHDVTAPPAQCAGCTNS
jgi:hypothetical protein